MPDDKIQVLVIEDEAILGIDLVDMLEEEGYSVIGLCDNGPKALELFQQYRIDLVLADIYIKGDWTGVDTIKRMTAIKSVAVIYVTSYSDKETVQLAKETSPSAYLTKPVSPIGLKIAIEIAIHNYKAKGLPSQKVNDKHTLIDKKDIILRIDDQVFIKHNFQFIRISLLDIILLEADNVYTTIITPTQKILIRLSLKDTLQKLGFKKLIRVHRSYAVNMQKIKSFTDREILIEALTIPMGQQYKDDFFLQFQSN